VKAAKAGTTPSADGPPGCRSTSRFTSLRGGRRRPAAAKGATRSCLFESGKTMFASAHRKTFRVLARGKVAQV